MFQAVVQHNVRLNGKLMGEEPRNMVQQLLERPKKQCLKFLADYSLTQQYFVAAGTEHEQQTTVFICVFFLRNHVSDFTYLCDFVTMFAYAVMQVLLAWSTWKYFPMCGIWYSKEKNIIEVPWLVLFLYNITPIQNSFVQCTIRASMKEPVNNK